MIQPGKPALPPLVPRYLSLWRALKFINNPIPVLDANLARYGSTYRFHIGGLEEGIVTTDPEIIRHVLQKNNRNYRKSSIQTRLLAHYIGHGLLTSEGEYWLKQRRLIQPGFHRQRLSNLISLMNREIQAHILRWSDLAKANATVDLYQEMHQLAFRIVAKTLFSTGLTEGQLDQLSNQITQVQTFIVRQIRQPFGRWWFRLSGQTSYYENVSQSTRKILLEIIRERLESKTSHDDLLQMLIDTVYEDTCERMTITQLLDESLILFIAGHETTANALAWSFYLLGNHPEYKNAIRKEAELWASAGQPSFRDLQDLTLTSQVIEEAMRLYPPAWMMDRVAIEDDIAGGFLIPSGTMIFLYIYGTHHHPGWWHDPETFNPRRFGKEQREQIRPFTYFPFGGGPRLCVGNHFALIEMQLVLTQMIHHFDFQLENDEIELLPLITLRPAKKLSVILRLRNGH